MIGFAGMSHLGLVTSIVAAAKGFGAVAFDPDASLTADLAAGRLPVFEPGLEATLAQCQKKLRFTSQPADLGDCQLVVVCPDVQTNAANQSDLTELNRLLDVVLPAVSTGTTLVVLSQVPPGFTRRLSRRVECLRDKKLALYGQVETLIFGRAVERASWPERFMLGCADPGQPLPAAYQKWLEAYGCPVLRMRYESAELAKIAINICLIGQLTVVNTLAEVCERIGADWSEIIPALKLDQRIGPYAYLQPGLGLSGGNLERDLATVRALASEHGADSSLLEAAQRNSIHRRDWLLRAVHELILSGNPRPCLAVWGLAYKPDTKSTKNAPAVALLEALPNIRFQAYDPQAELEPGQLPHVQRTESAMAALAGADGLLILTRWREFASIDPVHVQRELKGDVVIDPFAGLDAARCRRAGLRHIRLGVSEAVA
jgi:UDPglucose 6-dehydrogenase